MFTYHLRLALQNVRRNPVLAGLAVLAIGLGIGAATTTVSVYRLMATNPIEHRNEVLRAVTLDAWDPQEPFDARFPDEPPHMLTHRDALALLQSPIPARKAAMRFTVGVVESARDASPFIAQTRLTTRDFFAMFEVPFRYGGSWSAAADRNAEQVVVLSHDANRRAFGGCNSVGRIIRLDGHELRVVGVLDAWSPAPKFYDMSTGAFKRSEDIFLPFSTGTALQLQLLNGRCWNGTYPTFAAQVGGECAFVHFWAELDNASQLAAFQQFVDDYALSERALGRFQRRLNNKLYTPAQWLARHGAVPRDQRVLVLVSAAFLLICLLNVIGLLLAKFLARAPWVGLRRALGASRKMIFRQHMVEVALISLAGGVLGVGLAALGLFCLQRLSLDNDFTYASLARLDFSAGCAALVLAMVCGMAAGLYPTWRVCRIQPAIHLKLQ